MDAPSRRIVFLGKTGAGKSSTANTIFGETLFKENQSSKSEGISFQVGTRSVNGRMITLIDTPGFFDEGISEQDLKPEITKFITESAPGPHAFLIVLKVEKYTEHEQAVIATIRESFSEEAFKYAAVVFTHGDQLREGQTIEDFICEDKDLSDLVRKCGGRCHVVDNKYWKDKPVNEYRSNKFQVEKLLQAIDKMVKDNNDGYYTNEMLQAVQEEIQREKERMKGSAGNMSAEEIRRMVMERIPMISTVAASVVAALRAGVGELMRWFTGSPAADDAETPLEGAGMGAKAEKPAVDEETDDAE
ncbi:GTPase IMAP family member 7-like [Halichoeres trimaculatus]|uniref:GTPase IMAP family member 7-like n=1 Tax=Halichoeres trimaculatus TaxID=147232 RepID=UPI003D9DE55F